MARLCLILGMIGLLALAPGAQVEAQVQPGPPPAAGSPKQKGKGFYDPAKVVVVSGRITEVKRSVPQKPNEKVYVRLILQTPQGVLRVLLGPATYVDRQAVKIIAGDQVEVSGFRITTRRIWAIQVRKGNQVLRLRDANGHALWRGKKKPGI